MTDTNDRLGVQGPVPRASRSTIPSRDADALDREAVDGEPVGGGEDPLCSNRW